MAPSTSDMNQIESEAEATAAKHVANMLQRPDQLEKVDKYMQRELRKKASVDGVLKTAMQTQLDGVQTGLCQLEAALSEIKEINKDIQEITDSLKMVPELVENLYALKIESKEHSQCSAALENLEHILNIPKSVQDALDMINEGKLLAAHQSLAILEHSRDDLLYEMHKLANQSPTDKNMLKHFFWMEKPKKIVNNYGCFFKNFKFVLKEPKIIVSALRIIEREESEDSNAVDLFKRTGYMPIGRPKKGLLKFCNCFGIEGNQFEDRSAHKMWLVTHLEMSRQIIVEDLRVVKSACVPCFPPKYQIFEEYVKMYHDCLSGHLQDLIGNSLEDNEYISLLTWISGYGYLYNVKKNYRDWMKNALSTDVKDWNHHEGPDEDESGYFHTQLPLIMYNMLDQHLQVAQTVNKELVNSMMLLSFEEVLEFTRLFEEAIMTYRNKHFEDRSVVKFFTSYMIATANNCLQFCEFADKLRIRYSKDLTAISKNAEIIFCRTIEAFLKLILVVLKCLREELFMDLSSNLNEVMTRTWFLSGNQIVDTIHATLEDYGNDYTHLLPENFNLLITDVMNWIAVNYIYAVMQKRMTFKSYEERKQAAEKMCEEGNILQQLFQRAPFNKRLNSIVKKRSYYDGKITLENILKKYSPIQTTKTSPFEAVPLIAEVIKLKDVSMLSLEISGVIRHYPDVTLEQLVTLILVRGDVSKNEAKQLVSDIMAEIGTQNKERTIFSDITITL
ncbi:exocyst complex component 3 [Trichonephila inaurata madagascariensis]|uniref:Exocyst complex component 3 n=1 Tax=Trichonephila inaurata madagascariensis TaxID=2747483 RepID=A0A8X7BP95_9ARAC|nr:exocyst complex component 3 [Trichonephila inaurata madagascariensis]